MKYLSTKQISELWGISPRRVALLASQGRIAGAASAGNTWLIPEGTEKPADNRKKESKAQANNSLHEIYPYIVCMIHADSQINELTPEEKKLYQACMLYEEGEFYPSQLITETLLASHNVNIRLGAQYLLAFTCMYQGDYASAEKYSALFQNEYYKISDPTPEIKLLFSAYELEMGETTGFLKITEAVDTSALFTELLPFFAGLRLYSELVKFNLEGKMPELEPYEMMCRITEIDGYHYPSMYIHLLLFIFYAILNDHEKEQRHLNDAIDICVKHRFYFTLACVIALSPETCDIALSRLPDDVEMTMRVLIEASANARIEYADFLRKKNVFTRS